MLAEVGGDLMDAQFAWLLEGPSWLRYRAPVDLAHEPESSHNVQMSRRGMLANPQVAGLVRELRGWPGIVLNGRKSSLSPYHSKLKRQLCQLLCACRPPVHSVSVLRTRSTSLASYTFP